MSSWHGGKGSKPRPHEVSREEFADNWDRIFGKKDEKASKTSNSNKSAEPGEVVVPGLQPSTDSRRG